MFQRTFLWCLASLAIATAAGCLEPGPDLSQYTEKLTTHLPDQLEAQGWLNSEPLGDTEKLSGKVVVIDCWAYWCGSCRRLAPELEKTYSKYGEDGQVAFVGMTSDKEAKLPKIQAFLDKFDHRWPVAYGAGDTLAKLGAKVLPTVMVFDRSGRRVWNSFEPGTLDDAIETAIATKTK